MIRKNNDGDGVQSNQQPWRRGYQHDFNDSPGRHVTRSKSLETSDLEAPTNQERRMSHSVKSDTAYTSPTKRTHFTNRTVKDQGKSPISVFDVESESTPKETAQVQRDAADESMSKSRCLDCLDDELDLNAIEAAEWVQDDFGSSYFLDLGSIPRSFRLSSSNFSTRSDITGPTLFEPPDESNYRASPRRQPDSRRSLVTSPDAAPLRPQRQISKFDLTASTECHGDPSSVGVRLVDHIPTKPARQSSRRILSGCSSRETKRSVAMDASQNSHDSSPCKPMRQKSVSALLKKKTSERTTSLHCPSIDSSPPEKPQRKQSSRSLGSSWSSNDDSAPSQRLHQTITFHESILEEASSSECGAADT